MPNIVAIEITEQCLLVACAKITGRRYQISHLFEIETAEQSISQLGEKLQIELQERSFARADLVGVVNRRDAEMREVSVPPAPNNELPDLVRFQSRNIFASLNDNWLFDFVPFDPVAGEKQKVLAMAIAPEVKSDFETLAQKSGLNLKRILFRPYSIIELFDSQLDNQKNLAILLPVEDRLDIVVTAGKRVAAARTIQASSAAEDESPEAVVKQVVGELKRTLTSSRTVLSGGEVDEMIVAGDHPAIDDLKTVLKKSLDIPVEMANPLGALNDSNFTANPIPESTERFASLIGSLIGESNGIKPTVDFLNPRRPEVKQVDYRKLGIIAAGVALMILGGIAFRWITLSQQAKAIEKSQKQLEVVRKQNKGDEDLPGVDKIIGEVTALDQWYSNKINWLDELAWISDKMLSADDIRVSRFQGRGTKDGFEVKLNSKMTKQRSTETEWKQLFAERYLPNFKGSEEVAENDNSGFGVRRDFQLIRESNIDDTIDMVSAIMDAKLDAALDEEDGEPVSSTDAPEQAGSE